MSALMSQENPKKLSIRVKMKDFLQQWDNSSKKQRMVILERFIEHFRLHANDNNIYQLDKELGEITPLFFSRIMSSFQMNYLKIKLVQNHIECILIYLKTKNYKEYTERFINSGGIQIMIHILQHRKKHSSKQLQNTCLSIIKLIIKSNCNFKEIICMNNGVELLLDITVDKTTGNDYDLLYSLYDILKQLCIRNYVYTPTIHQLIIKYIHQNPHNNESIKVLLKVLQSTLSFNDDIRITSAHPKNKNKNIVPTKNTVDTLRKDIDCVDENLMNKKNVLILFQLVALGNNQVIHELQNLSNVVLRSNKAQNILLNGLIDLMNESNNDIKREYLLFIQNMLNRNINILNVGSKQTVKRSKVIGLKP
eukprot:34217_1